MRLHRLLRRRARGDERGAVLVEAAFVMPLFILLVFGIIEWSLALKDSTTVASAVRSGVRTASSIPRAENTCTGSPCPGPNPYFYDNTVKAVQVASSAFSPGLVEELWVYKANANGYPSSGNLTSCTTNCVRFTWNGGSQKFVATGGGGWPKTARNACAGQVESVGVYLKMRHDFFTRLFGNNVKPADKAVMAFEPVTTAQGCSG